jgi:hypothetical protein
MLLHYDSGYSSRNEKSARVWDMQCGSIRFRFTQIEMESKFGLTGFRDVPKKQDIEFEFTETDFKEIVRDYLKDKSDEWKMEFIGIKDNSVKH